ASVTAERTKPVSTFFKVTVTPGRTPPVPSVTTPDRSKRVMSARTGVARTGRSMRAAMRAFRDSVRSMASPIVADGCGADALDLKNWGGLYGGQPAGVKTGVSWAPRMAERYELIWPGKAAACRAARTPVAARLQPWRAESLNWRAAAHTVIEGENLDALKLL